MPVLLHGAETAPSSAQSPGTVLDQRLLNVQAPISPVSSFQVESFLGNSEMLSLKCIQMQVTLIFGGYWVLNKCQCFCISHFSTERV